MNRVVQLGVLALLVAMIAATVPAQENPTQENPAKIRSATIEQVMVGMVHPNYLAIEKAAKEGRVDAQTWKTLATNAALLNEASFLLVDDGRSLGDSWEKAAAEMRGGSATMLAKVGARDKAGIASELKNIAKGCVNCHAEYR